MILDIEKRKYLQILIKLKRRNGYTQQEIAEHLTTSERKVNSIMRGKLYDFWFLKRFANILGMNINFNLEM